METTVVVEESTAVVEESTAVVEESTAQDAALTEAVEHSVLVEDVSIDGMCGVY